MQIQRRHGKDRPPVFSKFTSHVKNWERKFFPVMWVGEVRPWWIREDGRSLFPTSWWPAVIGVKDVEMEDLSPWEQIVVCTLASKG